MEHCRSELFVAGVEVLENSETGLNVEVYQYGYGIVALGSNAMQQEELARCQVVALHTDLHVRVQRELALDLVAVPQVAVMNGYNHW